MWRAVWACTHEPDARIQHSCHAVDLRGLKRFFKSKRREDGRHALGEHGLAGAWGTDHENIVPARTGDLESAFGSLLTTDILEVNDEILSLAQQGIAI